MTSRNTSRRNRNRNNVAASPKDLLADKPSIKPPIYDNYNEFGILRFVKHGNIIRITHKKDRFVAIINSVPKYIIENKPKFDPNSFGILRNRNRNLTKVKYTKDNDIINISTIFSNHLSSILQRKQLKEVEFNVHDVTIGFITFDEYKQINDYIFQPDISSDVRGYYMVQKNANMKLVKRVIRGKCPIIGAMLSRPLNVVFEPKVLTIDYEKSLHSKESKQQMRRQQIIKKAKERTPDPINQYKLKQRMEKLKSQRRENRINKGNDKITVNQRTGLPIEPK
jgi:hypothetical protein